MLKELGYSDIKSFIKAIVPKEILTKSLMKIDDEISTEILNKISQLDEIIEIKQISINE